MKQFQVLLYYKYVHIDDPELLCSQQKQLCQKLALKGRILIADEGINGTLAGKPENIDTYIKETESVSGLNDIEWKISESDDQVFPRLRVAVRPEIVTLGLRQQAIDVTLANKASYIEPEELLELYKTNQDFVILDARNEYEAKVGKFKDALIPPIDNFREFPEFVQKHLRSYKHKPVITYCTGGIRCEKASAYLKEQGFTNVRQLHGGIHDYGDKTGGEYFEGEMFVFDKRLHIPINNVDPTTISTCEHCQTKISRYIDCSQLLNCQSLFICCQACEQKYNSTCSKCLAS